MWGNGLVAYFPPSKFAGTRNTALLAGASIALPTGADSCAIMTVDTDLTSPVLLARPTNASKLLTCSNRSMAFSLSGKGTRLSAVPAVAMPTATGTCLACAAVKWEGRGIG